MVPTLKRRPVGGHPVRKREPSLQARGIEERKLNAAGRPFRERAGGVWGATGEVEVSLRDSGGARFVCGPDALASARGWARGEAKERSQVVGRCVASRF